MLLVHPAFEKFGGQFSRYMQLALPVAVGVIAAYLKKWGAEDIKIVDEHLTPLDKNNIQEYTKDIEKPLIIGISVMTMQAGRAFELAAMFKEEVPDCTIVFGGVHVTALPHESLETGNVDFVVRGEGEEPMRELYFALRNGSDWKNIKGISYLNEMGEVINNEDGNLIENLDDVPMFPYELFDPTKYDLGHLASARGCPYKCSYCSQRILTGFTYRWHSTERIIENLNVLINQFNVKRISFYDDVFSVNKKRVLDLCAAIVDAGFPEKCEFSIQTRADNLYEDIMPALKSINTKTVGMGMETGVERVAEEIAKDETVATHLEKIALCKKYGISVSLFMIYGFPSESKEDREESYRVAKNAGAGFYPGTPIYDEAKKRGKVHILPGWTNCNSMLSITRSILSPTPLPYVPEGTTEYELKRDIIKRNLQYYFQWKIIKRLLQRDEGPAWALLPAKWYLKPDEILALTKITLVMGSNLILSFLPAWFGNLLTNLIQRNLPLQLPQDIKITSRKYRRGQTPSLDSESALNENNPVMPRAPMV